MATEKPNVPKSGVIDIPFSGSRSENFAPASAPKGEILNAAAVAPRAASNLSTADDEMQITRANLSMKPQPRASEKSDHPVDEDGVPYLSNEGPEGTSLKHALGISGKTDARKASYGPIRQYIQILKPSSGTAKPGKRQKKLDTKTVDNKYGGTREDVGNTRTWYKHSDVVAHLASRKHLSAKDAALHAEYSDRLDEHTNRINAAKARGETVPTLEDNRTFINSTFEMPHGRVIGRGLKQFTTQNVEMAIRKAGGTHLATKYPYKKKG